MRACTRQSLLDATVGALQTVHRMVAKGRLQGKDNIGVRVGRVINNYKVAKHFQLEIDVGHLACCIRQDLVGAEAALDGVSVIRTSLSEEQLSADDAIRSYTRLTQVERAFRSFTTMDLQVRPIRHRLENRAEHTPSSASWRTTSSGTYRKRGAG